MKITLQSVWAVCRMFDHFPLHSIELFLNSGLWGFRHCHAAGWCCQLVCMDDCSLCWCAAFEDFETNGLRWLCYYIIWSTEEGVLWFHSLTSRCLWSECLHLGWSRVSPFHAYSFSFQNKIVALCFTAPPQSAPAMRHCQYGVAAIILAILTCDVPNMCLSVHLGPTGSTAYEIQDFIWFHAQCQCS